MTRQHFPQTRHGSAEQGQRGSTAGYGLLEQAGYVRSSGAAGIHTLMPLGWKAHRKICSIVYEEMERAGVLNLQLPLMQTRELWEKTGRWKPYTQSRTMFVTEERHSGTQFGLAPTAEEMITAHVAAELRSWRELPLRLHQIGPKFRDELRPRLGLLRGREFSMSDAYSFDRDEEGMKASFDLFREIYTRIFARVGLDDVLAVQADSGAIGGSGSAEYMVPSEVGEDTLLVCERCEYGANVEKAESRVPDAAPPPGGEPPMRRVETPGITSVEALAERFPELPPQRMLKTIVYSDLNADPDEDLIVVCIRADLDVNEVRLAAALRTIVEKAPGGAVERATGARTGFAGPIDLRGVTRVLFDRSVEGMRNFLCGVNRTDVHALDVNFGRDLPAPQAYVDVHRAEGGHGCPECGASLTERKGIEVGHVFQLQKVYSESMGVTYTRPDGGEETPWMGCYGIGTTRLLQAIAEKNHDELGLRWPASVAPHDVAVVRARPSEDGPDSVLEAAVEELQAAGLSVIVDDRPGRAGIKFKDADLIGCPVRVVVGREANAGIVEVCDRAGRYQLEAELGELAAAVETALDRPATAQSPSSSPSSGDVVGVAGSGSE